MPQPSATPEKLTRKQRRQRQLREAPIAAHDGSNEANSVTPSSEVTLSSDVTLSLSSLTINMASPIRLLVCSIGNPGPYLNTLHSAGHTVLNSLASSLSYPSFQKSRAYGNGLVSAGSDFTLWQSSSQMNISGVGVAAAWRQFLKDAGRDEAKLIVVHDELELALGQVKVKSGNASPKGHNGLKSIRDVLKGQGYTRIGVGIGRPESRDPNIVANYVLRKMTGTQRAKIEGCVEKVEMELRRLRGV